MGMQMQILSLFLADIQQELRGVQKIHKDIRKKERRAKKKWSVASKKLRRGRQQQFHRERIIYLDREVRNRKTELMDLRDQHKKTLAKQSLLKRKLTHYLKYFS